MSPPSCQGSDAKPSPLLALVCASIVADHDRSWLARPLNALIPDGGPRPERISRLKTRLRPAFETELAQATRRGRPKASKQPEEVRRTSVLAALLAVATWLLTQSRVPTRRRAIQDHLVCAYDRLHAQHGVTQTEFCSVLDIPERTFRAWRARPPTPVPTPPPASPPPPPKNDRSTGRFDLEVTAPGVQLGGDTTDLKVFGIDLKLVGVQDLGAREQQLFEAFDVDDHEDADMVIRVLTEALAGRDSLQLISDQGTPYMAEAAKNAYEALGVEHAPQKEGTPTDKATVERGWNTVKGALEPLLDLTCRLAEVIPALRQADLARAVARLFLATFLRVYAAGRRHLSHPLEGQDPDALRAIIEEQREDARAENRSIRLFLERVHAEYAIPGSRETFVRAFKHYPLDDLHDAERRFRPFACRCQTRVCDRYFAAVVRDVHDAGQKRRAAARRRACAKADARRADAAAAQRAADLVAHPERRLHEAFDLLAETWIQADRFLLDGAIARIWLRCAVADFYRLDPLGALDAIEASVRPWEAAHPHLSPTLFDAVRRVLALVITDFRDRTNRDSPVPVGAILQTSARTNSDNPRPSPLPRLRI